ncbi:hypothetical protein PGTUg99_004405 [Puccinia graminis f. sp. tritici]|uniref:Uncharacterized protein n=1 Tax=Puccinia graminis f. sp. tritici TaxID=56615 RepID=A0A5B0RQD9_PUCGR|nr:hypothetical protein PGTUg99_004405 [Puccinia graminis f. sp. tritici]
MPTASSRVLCEETQSQSPPQIPQLQHTSMIKAPRVADITLDYLLYIELKRHADLSRTASVAHVNWEKLSPVTRLAPFEANIVAFTWPQFQTEAMIHVAKDCDSLRRFLFECQDDGKLVWMANIKNHPNYGVAVKIDGALDFLNFSTAAYEAFPANIAFKITMDNPTRKSYENEMRRQMEEHHRRGEAIKQIKELALVTRANGITIVHPEDPRQVMEVPTADLSEWARQLVQNEPAVTNRMPPKTDRFIWLEGRKRATPNPSEAPPTKRNTGPVLMTPPNRVMRGASLSVTPGQSDSDDNDDIEVIPISSGTTANRSAVQSNLPNAPVPPASPEMESHTMETYLHVAHIPKEDKLTRARLLTHGIVHWSFFRASSEQEMIGLGFPIGIARLLIEGAARLERYDHNVDAYTGGMSPSPSLFV